MQRRHLILLGIALLAGPACATQQLSVESVRYKITVGQSVLSDQVERTYSHLLAVVDKAANVSTEIRWIDHASDFKHIYIHGELAILFGTVSYSADSISVVNVKTHAEEMFALCRAPSISSDNRLISYLQFVPAHGPEMSSDAVLAVDLDLPLSRENADASSLGWTWAAASHGVIVFPPAVAGRRFAAGTLSSLSDGPLVETRLVWLAGGRDIVFVVRNGAEHRLVHVGFGESILKPVMREATIEVGRGNSPGKRAGRIRGLRLNSDGRVTIETDAPGREAIEMAIP